MEHTASFAGGRPGGGGKERAEQVLALSLQDYRNLRLFLQVFLVIVSSNVKKCFVLSYLLIL